MRNLILIFALSVSVVLASCNGSGKSVKLTSQIDSISYIMGLSDGERLIGSFERAKLDSVINIEKYFKGLTDVTSEKKLWLEPDSNQMVVQKFFTEFRTFSMQQQMDSTGAAKFEPEKKTVDSVSYLMGAADGNGLLESFKTSGLDTIIQVDIYLKGLLTTGKKGESPIDVEANMQMVSDFFQKIQDDRINAEFGNNKKAGEEFLAKNKANANVITTNSGLQYEVLVEGKGAKPLFTDQVKVHYTGTLLNGSVFDSSVERGEPAVFGVGQVIPGWTEVLQLMPVGSKYKVYIPQELAYGANVRPGGPIEPFMMLIFEVELLEIVK